MDLQEAAEVTFEPERVEDPELMVGIPSLNEEETIANVVEQVAGGLEKYYPERRAVIVNVDNASTDNTRSEFLNAESLHCSKVYISTEEGKKGKGRNFHNLFEYVSLEEPEAVVVVDADLTSIRPEWMIKFFNPILEAGCDFVTPYYKRHPYDGTITNNLCYPITYAVNKYNVRQPIGGDFAFAGEMGKYWLQENWYECTMQYGIDIFQTTTSIYKGGKIGITHLGKKAHKPSAPNLLPMFQEVCESLFNLLDDDRHIWAKFSGEIREPDRYFPPVGNDAEFPDLTVDTEAIALRIEDTYDDYGDYLSLFLEPALAKKVITMIEKQNYELHSDIWVEILLAAMKSYLENRDKKIIQGLLPVYFLRQISFIRKTRDLPPARCEEMFHEQAEKLRQLVEKSNFPN